MIGVIRDILNIIIFTLSSFRTNSYGIYFLALSICNIRMSHSYQSSNSFSLLKIEQVQFITMASFDRFMLCSTITLQQYFCSGPKRAYRVFKILNDFCLILPFHMALSYVF